MHNQKKIELLNNNCLQWISQYLRNNFHHLLGVGLSKVMPGLCNWKRFFVKHTEEARNMSFWGITNSVQVKPLEGGPGSHMLACMLSDHTFRPSCPTLPYSCPDMLGQFGRYSAILWVWERWEAFELKQKKKINYPLMEPTSELQMSAWRII